MSVDYRLGVYAHFSQTARDLEQIFRSPEKPQQFLSHEIMCSYLGCLGLEYSAPAQFPLVAEPNERTAIANARRYGLDILIHVPAKKCTADAMYELGTTTVHTFIQPSPDYGTCLRPIKDRQSFLAHFTPREGITISTRKITENAFSDHTHKVTNESTFPNVDLGQLQDHTTAAWGALKKHLSNIITST